VSTRPPSGTPPPAQALMTGGSGPIDLVALARTICERYRGEFPDEQERYGDAGMAWCVHDNQHIVNWAVGVRNGYVDLERELAWLARVLEAREFPLDRLARNLEIAAEVAGDELGEPERAIADDLAAGARFVRSRPTFLDG
jgi:hypothetical protein